MIHVVAGLPGPFTHWCAAATAAVAAASGRSVILRAARRLADLGPIALEAGSDDIVCVAHTADAALIAALGRSGRPCLIALDAPMAVLARLGASDGVDVALRQVTASCASASSLAEGVRATLLSRPAAEADPQAALAQVAACFGLPAGGVAPPLDAGPPPPALPARMGPAVAAALAAYPDGLFSPRRGPIVLMDALFLQGTPPHAPVCGPIDVTGRPRFLFFGPYLCLPIGDWDMAAFLDISQAAVGGHYSLDASMARDGVIEELSYAAFAVSAPGPQEVRLSFRVEAPENPIEFRLRTLRAMFDGTVTLSRVELRRRAPEMIVRAVGTDDVPARA